MANNVEAVYPLSPLQQGLLFHTLSRPGEPTYFEQIRCAIEGNLDRGAFERAWNWVIARHTVLRSAFAWQRVKEPIQVVGRSVTVPLDWADWRERADPDADWTDLLAQDRARGFDLAKAPLMRLILRQTAENRHLFVWSHHHILLDGWSFGTVLNEVLQCYSDLVATGEPSDAPPVRPFGDYIAHLGGLDAAAHEEFWQEYLSGVGAPTRLAPDRGHGVHEGGSGNEIILETTLGKEISTAIRRQCAELGVSLSTLVHGAWARLLGGYSGEREVLFGSTTAGRPPELSGVEQMVGLFINAVPLRILIDPGQAVGDWLLGVQRDLFRLQEHQFTGLSRIQELSDVERGKALFETLLSFQNYPLDGGHEADWAGIRLTDYGWTGPTNYPVAVRGFSGDEIMLVLTYYQHRLDDAVAEVMLDQLKLLVEQLGTRPQSKLWEIEPVAGPHAEKILRDWNATEQPFALDRTLHGLAEWQATVRPDAVAVVAGDGRLTYAALEARANQLAHHLVGLGVQPGDLVGLCTEKSTATVVAMLAVMKSGAAYVPLDPAYPAGRIASMVADAKPAALLTWGNAAAAVVGTDVPSVALDTEWEVVAQQPENPLDLEVSPDAVAYVIYTSGSSGAPKGVVLDHRGRVNNVEDYCQLFDMGPDDRTLCVSSLSFDISVCDLFCSLNAGGTLVFPAAGKEKDPDHWLDLIGSEGITLWHSAPALMDAMLDAAAERSYEGDSLRLSILDGDWIPLTQPDRVRTAFPSVSLVSAGGATELSVDSVTYPVGKVDPEWRSIPYGRPMANQSAYILGEDLQVCPVGVPGELHFGGTGLAFGYLERPELTAEKFIPHPWPERPGERLYRTGDLARFGADGVIELLGRIDLQVKIRGIRIELGEIEAVLRSHPAVEATLAAAPRDNAGDRRLAAYVVAVQAGLGDELAGELRAWLRARLPEQLVPEAFVLLDKLPLTANGKVDRKALPMPCFAAVLANRVAPETELEIKLAAHWAGVLGLSVDEIDVESSFFDMGGNSLKALRACRVPDQPIAITDLYRFACIRSLAEHLASGDTGRGPLVRLTTNDSKPVVICVPYGGGHAGVYQPLAKALGDKVALYAVRLPGHEHDGSDEQLQPVDVVARSVADAAAAFSGRPVLVYGHCGGVALATEVASLLERAGADLRGLFVGASYPPENAADLDDDVFAAVDDIELAMQFAKLGGFTDLDESEAKVIGRLLRHDGTEARGYFRHAIVGERARLRTPLTCLIGADDPLTTDYATGWLGWAKLAAEHELVVLPGDHYFVNEHAAQVARHLCAALDAFEEATR
jgi:amino acid adenylation domain-containing protein